VLDDASISAEDNTLMSNDNRRKLNDEILQIAVTRLTPQPQWALIIGIADRQVIAAYPVSAPDDVLQIDDGRKVAISRAAASTGERVSTEMGNLILRECIIYGTDGIFIMLVMNHDLVLSVNFAAIPSLDDTLSQLQDTVEGINKLLNAMG
jgi:predicted regulator of Ras-like GTPase activity (Roadblock/LC7/MglB family)